MQPSVRKSWYVCAALLHTRVVHYWLASFQGKTLMLNVEYKVQKEVSKVLRVCCHEVQYSYAV